MSAMTPSTRSRLTRARVRAKARTQLRREVAEIVAEDTADAYMADVYGPAAWKASATLLLQRNLISVEVMAFLRSKHMRWADDAFGRGAGAKATSGALRKYIEAQEVRFGDQWLAAEAASLAAGE